MSFSSPESPLVLPNTTHQPVAPHTERPRVVPTSVPVNNFCAGRPDGVYANQADRTSFIHCAHGNTFIKPCPSGLLFNINCLCCDWPRNVNVQ